MTSFDSTLLQVNLNKFKEYHIKAFFMVKQDTFHTYILADEAIDILESNFYS